MKVTASTHRTASKNSIDDETLMKFEGMFEPELQMDLGEKKLLLATGTIFHLWYGDKVVAEQCVSNARHLAAARDSMILGDIQEFDAKTPWRYIYSTAVVPEWHGHGYARILSAYVLGYLRAQALSGNKHVTHVFGHSTSSAMTDVRSFLGARFLKSHESWFGTERTAHFYVHRLG